MTSSDAIRSQMPRDVVFISHANPEDNQVTLWLALRLAREGYKVWSDLTQLIGGEDFWLEAEDAIRNSSAKFLYVLSRASNSKDGPRSELQVAKNVARDLDLKDFIVPLKVDDLPSRESNIQIAKINNISFGSWAAGLNRLLDKLEKDRVPRDQNAGPGVVASWWRKAQSGPDRESELLDSNWFEIRGMPGTIKLHHLKRDGIGLLKVDVESIPFPAIQVAASLMSFASTRDLEPYLGNGMRIAETTELFLGHDGAESSRAINRRQVSAWAIELLRQAWERTSLRGNLRPHELANRRVAYYLTADHRPSTQSRHQVTGYKTIRYQGQPQKRIWHYAIDARPLFRPLPLFSMTAHVLFSDDGKTIWNDAGRLQRARGNQCKDWWNGEWRGKLLAYLEILAGTDENVRIRLDGSTDTYITTRPIALNSPVSYAASPDHHINEAHSDDDEDVDWDDDDE